MHGDWPITRPPRAEALSGPSARFGEFQFHPGDFRRGNQHSRGASSAVSVAICRRQSLEVRHLISLDWMALYTVEVIMDPARSMLQSDLPERTGPHGCVARSRCAG